MYKITGTNISLTRGDTMYLDIILLDDGETYVPEAGDTIRFAMKSSYNDRDEDAVLIKDIPTSTMQLKIAPEDTKSLPMRKKYVYDIQLTTGLGDVYTFIEGTFTVMKEVL